MTETKAPILYRCDQCAELLLGRDAVHEHNCLTFTAVGQVDAVPDEEISAVSS